MMKWAVKFHSEYLKEFNSSSEEIREKIIALAKLLEALGPALKRPHCDTLKESRYANMKELRFSVVDGEWRIAFAFDIERKAVLLVGGSKSGVSEPRFYRDLIRIADERFTEHLIALRAQKEK